MPAFSRIFIVSEANSNSGRATASPCGQCGRTRRVAVTARDGQPDLCPTCHQAPTLVWGRCCQTGPCRTTTPDRSPICWRCQLHRQLEQTLGPHVPAPLRPLLQALRSVEQPRTVLGWLARSPAVPVLAAMTTGQAPVHHQALDTAGAGGGGRSFAIEHLRQLLVASGALPIDTAHPDDQPILRAYATWHVLLYGQTLSRISRLRRADLDIATEPSSVVVHLRLGTDAIEIGEPLATLLQGLPVLVTTGTAQASQAPSSGCSPDADRGAPPTQRRLPTGYDGSGSTPAPPATAPCSTSQSTCPPASWQTSSPAHRHRRTLEHHRRHRWMGYAGNY